MVSQAALSAGGYVHGVLPHAFVERVEDNKHAVGSTEDPESNGRLKSAEGAGQDLLKDDPNGRMTVELVASMHTVSSRLSQKWWTFLQTHGA